MSKINVLSSKVFNRISAGEVVERPSSVVKELVENSIDAGATEITIEILDGGISQIKISDNGNGIEKSELSKAILPHATSKIETVSDLDAIKTLGFRGEALASISAVSKMTIISNTTNADFGGKLYAEGGENVVITDEPAVKGTTIIVNNLFYNTPVRARFLKTAKSEESEISSLVSKFILGNSNISFVYIIDGKKVFQSFGEGLESSFISIYGVENISNCHNIYIEKHGIKISGYVGKPSFYKANRSYQTVFLNGRLIVNQTISSAITNAYSSYLMKRQYPFYVINITIPNEYVDVNVHPNKIDVRFSNNQIVYGTIYSVISKVLDGSQEVLNIVVPQKQLSPTEVINKKDEIKIEIERSNTPVKNPFVGKSDSVRDITFCDSVLFDKIEDKIQENKKDEINDIFLENKAYLEKLEKEKQEKQINAQQTIEVKKDLKLIGQALNTFLILEDGEDLYLIDQHAAHERLLFDKIVSNVVNKSYDIQPLLFPFVLDLNNAEYDFVLAKIDILRSFGLDIDEFGGNSFKVSAIPTYLESLDLKKFFNEILSDMNTLKSLTLKDILMEKLAQKACKSAIKSGDKLDDSEIDSLLKMINGNLSLKCPHGRPIAVKITRNEIDKWFKRIV